MRSLNALRCIHRILTRHGIDYKQRFRWIDGLFYGLNFLHHFRIHGQTTGGIHDDRVVVPMLLRMIEWRSRAISTGLLLSRSVYTSAPTCFPTTSSWSIAAGRYTSHAANRTVRPAFLLLRYWASLPVCVVFTRTLKACHEDDGRFSRDVHGARLRPPSDSASSIAGDLGEQ